MTNPSNGCRESYRRFFAVPVRKTAKVVGGQNTTAGYFVAYLAEKPEDFTAYFAAVIFAGTGMEEAAKEKLVEKRFSVFCSCSRVETRRVNACERVRNKGTWIPESARRASTMKKFSAYLADLTKFFPAAAAERKICREIVYGMLKPMS